MGWEGVPLKLLLEDKRISLYRNYLSGSSWSCVCIVNMFLLGLVRCLFRIIWAMGLRRTVGIFASLSHPFVATQCMLSSSTWILHWLCNIPGYGINELGLSQKPQITFFTFICTDIYLHLCVLCPRFANLQITNLVSKRTHFLLQISSLPESKQAFLSPFAWFDFDSEQYKQCLCNHSGICQLSHSHCDQPLAARFLLVFWYQDQIRRGMSWAEM